MALQLLVGAGTLAIALAALYVLTRKTSSLPLPPGPKRLPLIGNVLDFPQSFQWLTFQKWGKQYGDVMSVEILGQTIVILNSLKSSSDVLDKSSVSFARPRMIMGGMIGWGPTAPFTNDQELHRTYRRMYSNVIGQRSAPDYWPVQVQEVRRMVAQLLDTPEELRDHISRMSVAVIALVTHGYRVESTDDRYAYLALKNIKNFLKVADPGHPYMVDAFPFLRFIPAWFPGAGFQKDAAQFLQEHTDLKDELYDWTKSQVAAGTAIPSMTSKLMQQDLSGYQDLTKEDLIKYSGVGLYNAGSDTSSAAVHTFVLAMLLYPDVQAKAQAELDEVVGKARMPTFQDRDKLPYCTAVVKETLRWRPTGPLGVPHALTEDLVYEGYLLPKDSVLISNIWSIMHDPDVYPSPDKFNPERFISKDGTLQSPPGARDFVQAAFGFGRRVCPGANLAENTVFIAAVSLLWAFNMEKLVGANGRPIDVEPEYLPGIIAHPKEFPCSLRPRFEAAPEIIRQAAADAATS